MAIFNPNELDFTKEEIKAVSEAVYARSFEDAELNMFFEVDSGIKKAKQIAILGHFSSLLGAGTGGCDPTPSTNAIPLSQKIWNPVTISDRLSICWTTDVKDTFFQWATKNGLDRNNLDGTDFAAFLVDRMQLAMKEMLHRLAWFNDTDAALVTASPAGVITAGTNVAFFNRLDGIWKQAFSIAAADTERLTAGLETRNAGVSYAAQKFTAADTTNLVVSKMFDAMGRDADERLTASDNIIIACTKTVWDQYKSELKFAGIAYSTERLESGIEVLYADGYEVHKISVWDRIIKAYFNNGTTYYLPHRAIMYPKSNLRIGTEEESGFSEVGIFYDQTTKKTNFDFQFDIDAKIIEDNLIQVAY